MPKKCPPDMPRTRLLEFFAEAGYDVQGTTIMHDDTIRSLAGDGPMVRGYRVAALCRTFDAPLPMLGSSKG